MNTASQHTQFDILFHFEPLHAGCRSFVVLLLHAISQHGEMSLEIPIDVMAGIAGARHAVEFKGGVALKGFSTVLVLIER